MIYQSWIYGLALSGLLMSGCRNEYLMNPELVQAAQTIAAKGDHVAASSQKIAIFARRLALDKPGDPAIIEPAHYVKLSALRVDIRPPTGYWRASTRRRVSFLASGGVLLGIAVGSLLAGGILTGADLSGPPAEYRGLVTDIIGIPALTSGVLELIPGVILLALGGPRVEVPLGERGMFYVTEANEEARSNAPAPAIPGLLATAPAAVGVNLRF